MKKGFLLIALASIALHSCTKHNTTYTTQNIDNRDTTGFVVKGLADMDIESRDTIWVPLMVERVSGVEQKVTLSASGLPANVTVTFSPESGYDFQTMMTIVTNKAALGGSNIKIVASSNTGSIRTYDVKLNIMPKMYCIDEIIGNYLGDNKCTADTDSVAVNIMPASSANMITISNLVPAFFTIVNAKITCEGQMISIPSQMSGPYTIWGTGSFATDSVVKIDYWYDDGAGDTTKCSTHLTRQ